MSSELRPENGGFQWFALRVKPNHEKRVSELIDFQGYEEFLPLYRVRRRWAQRTQDVDMPVFAGYIFCRFDRPAWAQIMKTPGIVDAVRFGTRLAPVDEDEISALQAVQRSRMAVHPWPYLQVGQTIRVTAGPLAGRRGILVELKGQTRLVLSISLLQRSVLVEMDREWITCDAIPLIGLSHTLSPEL